MKEKPKNMKAYFSKNEHLLNTIIIIMLFLQVFILNWFHLSVYAGYIFDVLMLMSISIFYKKYDSSILKVILIICLYFIINFIINRGSLRDLVSNFRYLLQPALIIVYIAYLTENNLIKSEFIRKMIKPFNVYMILNMIAIFFQIKGYTWTAGLDYSGFHTFTVFEDSISGLFGVYGVPFWGMFSIFLFLFNHIYFNKYSEKKNRTKLNIYNICLLLCVMVVSTMNDNKMFFVFLPVFLLVFFMNQIVNSKNNKSDPIKTLKQLFIITAVGLLLFFGAYILIDKFAEIINKMTWMILRSLDYKNAYNNGSGERIALVLYFFNELNILFGYGLGNGRWTQEELLGYKHFGISDFGTILCLGGMILFILIFVLFYLLFNKMFKKQYKTIVMILVTALVMFCTQIVYNASGMMLYMLICLIFYWQDRLASEK